MVNLETGVKVHVFDLNLVVDGVFFGHGGWAVLCVRGKVDRNIDFDE